MKAFKFFLAPDVSYRVKRTPFFKKPFVQQCITAKETLMERHTISQIIDYAYRKEFILITKNRSILDQDKKLYRSIVIVERDITMNMLQQKLNADAEKIYKWLLLDKTMTYKIDSSTVPMN